MKKKKPKAPSCQEKLAQALEALRITNEMACSGTNIMKAAS